MDRIRFRHIGLAILLLKLVLIIGILAIIIPADSAYSLNFDERFFLVAGIGFFGQLIDGALGMAYGISCSSLLMGLGVSPVLASASVHTAEVFTSGISGLSHLRFGNLNKRLFLRIVITGSAGSIAGALMLSTVMDGALIKPWIGLYLALMGLSVLRKGLMTSKAVQAKPRYVEWLALAGGFFDAFGGGGWGPIVTSNILHQGNNPRETIGTVSTAEFFVTFFSTGIFLMFVGVESWSLVMALILGGVIAAPLGAWYASKISRKWLMLLTGGVIIIVSLYSVYTSWF